MEVKIDYDQVLINSEKYKIKWLVDEFDFQFNGIKKVKNKFTAKHKKISNEFLDYWMEKVDVTEPIVLDFFQTQLEQIERKYPLLFSN